MGTGRLVRDATIGDAARCAEVYAPYVRDTVISFELEPPTAAEVAGRIEAALATHAWLVVEDAGRVVGYAYGSTFNARGGYRWSTSVSVYTEPGLQRTGAGRALYTALFQRLAARGYRTALAGVALPNAASAGLHLAMGFEPVGTYRRVAWKLGRWHDVTWYQRPLGDHADDEGGPPALPH
ncbi:GNAT family N-acetyltransferase [Geodermatophilus sp. DSM 44513]|uniref:GNAT family N-acetyltransferase n=1 Tax=Geodermatophilus sp. DSM 44513 TaxID=1528104 RepID=UPI00128411E2|nr:GNAT family N-acetyltransferase [Geodermatophilus sp. DSM 44513]WNV73714.1 N-acetyltransferase family protein [Geodermatophilus sp. DSM 44513]